MKATIVHESRGRMRLRLNIPRLSVADADRLELWLAVILRSPMSRCSNALAV